MSQDSDLSFEDFVKKYKIDVEEQELLKAVESDEFEVVRMSDQDRLVLQQIASNTIKAKNINMRVRPNDLEALKKKAKEVGIGYQTILTALIRQYINGKIRLEL